MERSLSAEAVQGSVLRKGSRPQIDMCPISRRKEAPRHLAPGKMQMKAIMMVSFTPVRMEPLECTHFLGVYPREWKDTRQKPANEYLFIFIQEKVCRVLSACETECKHVAVYVYGKT